jgi:hypothetical protein
MTLRPFWCYYGGKNRAAHWYPAPEHDTIVEPFAGAAGYACRYPDRQVILVDANPIICGVWRYLIASTPEEILQLPDIPKDGTVDDLPICQEGQWLAGFWCNKANVRPMRTESVFSRYSTRRGHVGGWSSFTRQRIASQVDRIKHWQVIEGDYTTAPDIEATWFIDPPYNNKAGFYYPHQPQSFDKLGAWCRARQGLAIVCENKGARWLPFKDLKNIKNTNNMGSAEVIWINRAPKYWTGVQKVLF